METDFSGFRSGSSAAPSPKRTGCPWDPASQDMAKVQTGTVVADGEQAVVSKESGHVTVRNVAGLHARASLAVLNLAKTFSSQIHLVRGQERAAATDMLQLLCLGAPEGTELVVEAEGVDAKLAVAAIAKLFELKFYEDDMEGMRPVTE